MKKILPLVIVSAVCFTFSFIGAAQGQIIYTDFGTGAAGKKHADGVADSLGNYWSNVTAISGSTSLVTTTNAASGITLTMSGNWQATTDSSSSTPIATLGPGGNSAFAYTNVIDDGIFMTNGAAAVATMTLTGLNDSLSYNFSFLGSFGRNDARWATFTIGASSAQVLTSTTAASSDGIKNYNDDTVVSILGAKSSGGSLTINMTGSQLINGGTPGAYAIINAMGIATVPEPTSLALLGLGGLAILGFRRRRTA